MAPRKLQPAALGGLFIGVLSALPVVSLGNCCCLWILGGGFLAAYLMQQDHPQPITAADGALVGLLAGLFGAVVMTMVSIPIGVLMSPFQEQILRQLQTAGDLPPEAHEILDSLSAAGGSRALGTVLGLLFALVLFGLFAPVGGILGALFTARRPTAPPAAPPSPPPSGHGGWPSGS